MLERERGSDSAEGDRATKRAKERRTIRGPNEGGAVGATRERKENEVGAGFRQSLFVFFFLVQHK